MHATLTPRLPLSNPFRENSQVFFITTTLVSLSIIFVKGYAWPLAVLFFVVFGFLDGIFWGSSIRKVSPQ